MNGSSFISTLKLSALIIGVQICFASAALSQTQIKNDRLSIRDEVSTDREIRRSNRAAKNYESDYKTTHLNTQTYNYKTAKSGRKVRNGNSATKKQQKTWKVKKGIKHR